MRCCTEICSMPTAEPGLFTSGLSSDSLSVLGPDEAQKWASPALPVPGHHRGGVLALSCLTGHHGTDLALNQGQAQCRVQVFVGFSQAVHLCWPLQ